METYNITFDADQYENKIDYYTDYYHTNIWEIEIFIFPVCNIHLNKNLKIKNHHKLLINICYLLNKYTE